MADFKEVTPSVVRGVVTNRLIDLDQVVEAKHHHIGLSDTDLKGVLLHGVQKNSEKENKEMQEEIISNPQPEEVVTDVKEEAEEPAAEETIEATVSTEEPAAAVAPAPKKRTRSTKK